MKNDNEKLKNKRLTKEDQKILRDLNTLIKKVTNLLEKYRFDLAAEKLYHFLWHRFADEYLEYAKKEIRSSQLGNLKIEILNHVYLTCLKLLHPFMPFITEEIWQRFCGANVKPLIISPWPKPS